MAALRQGPAVLTLPPTAFRALAERFAVTPKRSLGQHFVVDANTVRRIARISGAGPGDRVLEIGAGLGSLTLALAEAGADVRAVEVDEKLVAALHELFADAAPTPARRGFGRVEIIRGDARRLDLRTVLAGSDRWKLVANLPYNIATPLVLDLLRGAESIGTMTVMLQREVADRLIAPPGAAARGVPSVLVELHATAAKVATVGPNVFWPPPKVESAVVRIERRPVDHSTPLSGAQKRRFEKLLRLAFAQRRKMLRRSLAAELSQPMFAQADVDSAARPQDLTLREWLDLARA